MFSLTQLRAFGLTPSAVHKRVAVGRLHRVHHGVYSLLPPTLLSREGRFLAAVLACGPGAVLSHRSAVALHELRRTDRAGIDVTVPGRTSHSHDGIDVHRSTTLLPADTVEINRIPCTTIPRTLLDLAAVVGRRSLERALDQAEVLEALDAGALAAQIERNRATRAAKLLRAVLDEHRAGPRPRGVSSRSGFWPSAELRACPRPRSTPGSRRATGGRRSGSTSCGARRG